MKYEIECTIRFTVEAVSKIDAYCTASHVLMNDLDFDYDEDSLKINTTPSLIEEETKN